MKPFFFIALVFSSYCAKAQQQLTLEQCDSLFLKNNLMLLASQYDIDIAKAQVIQAGIWDLPILLGEFNAYNPTNSKFFDVGSTGQKALAVQQLIYLGGKKKNEVDFAKGNVDISALQFAQLLRSLRSQIRKSFYSIHFDNVKMRNIYAQVGNIDSLAEAYNVQAQKGNVPLKDVVRLQSLALNLRNDLTQIQNDQFNEQENLRVLTRTYDDIIPIVNQDSLNNYFTANPLRELTELQTTAIQKNPDQQTYQKIAENQALFLKWQKSLATPDLTVGTAWDQRGGAFNNQVNIVFGMPLPLWNRNKGNIQVAEKMVEQSKLILGQKELELSSRVATQYRSLEYQKKQYHQISAASSENFELVYQGVLSNFQKRNITLIEFTDFMESYNQSNMLINEIKKQIIVSGENLRYLVNDKIYK